MKWAISIAFLLVAAALVQGQTPRAEMSATQVIEGLLSQDAGLKDRACTELGQITKESAEKVGAELLRYGVRETQLVLHSVATADKPNAAIIALCALESENHDVRSAALNVFTRVSPATATGAAEHGLTARRQEALRKLLEDGRYLRAFCEGIRPEKAKGARGPVEEAMRLMVLLDRKLGARGMALVLRQCAALMQGDQPAENETPAAKLLSEKLRRGATLLLEAVLIGDAAILFNYQATAGHDARSKAAARIRAFADEMENREEEHTGKKLKGWRYGDYLIAQWQSDVTETRAAAYLRLKWWRGDDEPLAGERYPEAVDRINALPRREATALRAALKKWWVEYRAKD
ncbi:MAG: hypothetical protein KF696_08610 [Planctomycetes bacterium]|nr:hypothetical protein [Planctomycetota bacterium]MCW8135588.1 hypothetical protein [Planctomycetota bacterium]